MIRVYFKIILCFCFFVFLPQHAKALDCDDISDFDKKNSANGGYIFAFGCGDASYDFVYENYKKWPTSIIKIAGQHYMLEDVGPLTESKIREHLMPSDDPFADLLLKIQLSRFLPSINEFQIAVEQVDIPEKLRDELKASLYFAAEIHGSKESVKNYRAAKSLQTASSSQLPYVKQLYMVSSIIEGRFSNQYDKFIQFFFDNKENSPHLQELLEFASHDLADVENADYRKILDVISYGLENRSPWASQSMGDTYYFGRFGVAKDVSASLSYFEEPALYGNAGSQYAIGYLYYWGEGVEEDEEYGVDWLNLAAENWELNAVDELSNFYISQNNYEDALRIMLANAEMGYLDFSNFGYQAAYILANEAFEDKGKVKKFREYLLHHCLENPFIEDADKQGCYMSEQQTHKSFSTNPTLVSAFLNSEELRYQSDLDLKSGKYRALVIGNWDYKNWSKLETPRQDVLDVSKALEELDFEVEVLVNADRRDVLKAIYNQGSKLEFNDHFLIYYAGHGIIDRGTDVGYWIPASASRDFQPDWISSSEIMNALKSIPARHVLLVADSCYSGKLLRSGAQSLTNPSSSMIERLFEKKARVAITSGGEEPVADSIQGSKNSVFAAAFLDALSAIDSPTPASTLFNNILGEVSVKANQTPQYSDMRELGHDGGDFIFIPNNQ